MFYTKDTIMVSEGEKITGTLKCSPNVRNNRDLDITISYINPDGTDEFTMDYKMYDFVFANSRLLIYFRA